MRVDLVSTLRPSQHQADRLVVYDSYGNPIMLAVQLNAHSTITATVNDPEFPHLLEQLGIRRTTLVTTYQPQALPGPG